MIRTGAYSGIQADGNIVCLLCPAKCVLSQGKAGICRSRFNHKGSLVTDNYGEAVTLAVDPIEKKPLYHYYPGASILSTGPNCCNLVCLHCQNWRISQEKTETTYYSPERLVEIAAASKSLGVAFTYSEPIVWFEYIMDTAPLLRKKGMKVVLVTNGYVNQSPLEELLTVTDAMNIDLKGISREFYARICKGRVEPVFATIRRVAASDVHLELTNLIIPGENDSDRDIQGVIDFVTSLSDLIPIHFSAFHPDYRLQRPSTPTATLLRAYELASQKLKFVYLGNAEILIGRDTACPACGHVLIRRTGYDIMMVGLTKNACQNCGYQTGIRV